MVYTPFTRSTYVFKCICVSCGHFPRVTKSNRLIADMNQLAPWSSTLADEQARLMGQPRIPRFHEEACSPSAPLRSKFPLANEILDVVLHHVIRDNSKSYNDVLSFLLTCKGCNKPGFKQYLYRTVCFAPNPKSLAILKGIADDPARAKLVKAILYEDAAPTRLEAAAFERAGLSYRDHEFHRSCRYDRMMDPCLWSAWWDDNDLGWMDKFINLEEILYRPTRSMPYPTFRPKTQGGTCCLEDFPVTAR